MTKPYYDEDGITLYHGDCRDILPALAGPVDLLLTDPPYGMGFSGQGATSAQANISADGVRQGVRVVRQALFEAAPLLADDAHLLMFCHWQSWPDFYDAASAYVKLRNALIWHKASGGQGNIKTDYLRNYEVILYGSRGAREIGGEGAYSAVLSGFARPAQQDRHHFTEKPEPLMRHLIGRHAPPGGLVLDPFVGSGTTLVAARAAGRRAIGIEIDAGHCATAVKRLAQGNLFVEAA